MNIPETTTHVWKDAVVTPTLENVWGYTHRLPYFKQVDGEWWVFSELTGWRKSQNTPEWFKRETEEGFFVTVEEYLNE